MVDIHILYSQRSGGYADRTTMDTMGFDTQFCLVIQLGRDYGRLRPRCKIAHIYAKLYSKCDLLTPRLRIEVYNAGTECIRVQKSVELCEKVWNFSIASHTTTPKNFFYSDFALQPNDFASFDTISPP